MTWTGAIGSIAEKTGTLDDQSVTIATAHRNPGNENVRRVEQTIAVSSAQRRALFHMGSCQQWALLHRIELLTSLLLITPERPPSSLVQPG